MAGLLEDFDYNVSYNLKYRYGLTSKFETEFHARYSSLQLTIRKIIWQNMLKRYLYLDRIEENSNDRTHNESATVEIAYDGPHSSNLIRCTFQIYYLILGIHLNDEYDWINIYEYKSSEWSLKLRLSS